jgi:hypothetical protein
MCNKDNDHAPEPVKPKKSRNPYNLPKGGQVKSLTRSLSRPSGVKNFYASRIDKKRGSV